MRTALSRSFTIATSSLCLFAGVTLQAHAQFTQPTKEELSMTSQAEAPGAPAVYLFREEITEDTMHTQSYYVRLKVLNEKGKDYATIKLREYSAAKMRGFKVVDIQARTIHADGTVIPYVEKPSDALVEQRSDLKAVEKVLTLPDVEVGSIIEYRYKLEYYDHYFYAPMWQVQTELFTRKAHYLWRPTREPVVSTDEKGAQVTNSIAWTPILPKDAVFTHDTTSGTGIDAGERGQTILELKIQNVPPIPHEEFMPPLASMDYRVMFYYSPYRSGELFWKGEGSRWAAVRDQFIGPGPKVKDAVAQLVSSSDTQDQKLRKIYAAVMKIENMSYTRGFTLAGDKAHGIEPPKTSDELWERKSGHSDEITELFVAMARAAGMKAYVMGVTDRRRALFMPNWLNLSQIHDYIAIVEVDGKEQFFDPDVPLCPYGQLTWAHAATSGLREVEGGTKLASTPGDSYKDARVQRVANLTLDEHGVATGTVKMTWIGVEAMRWRQTSLRGDVLSLQRDLRTYMEGLLPREMVVSISGIQNADDYEKPFVVTYDVQGRIGSATGKRLLLSGEIFESNARAQLTEDKRQVPVYFNYPYQVTDAIRIGFPPSLSLETATASQSLPFQKSATYSLTTESTPTSVTIRRDLVIGNAIYPVADYGELRTFFSKLATKDKDPIVLKLPAGTAGN